MSIWTAEQDAKLIRLWPTKTASHIGREIGKSRNAVIGRIHRLQGNYADYVSPTAVAKRAAAAKRRDMAAQKEATALQEMKRLLARGSCRDDAIRAAVKAGARLRGVAEVIGVTQARIQQIAPAALTAAGAPHER